MESPAIYGPTTVRPRLTVLRDDGGQSRYSALPHAVLMDRQLSHGAIVTYAVMQMYWRQGSECWASHATLAQDVRCSGPQLRRYIGELVAAGYIVSRMRGQGQAKAYAPSQPLTGEQLNRSPVSTSEPNRSPVSEQPLTGEQLNRSPVSTPKKKKQEKKKHEENSTAPTEPARSDTKSGQLIDLLKADDVPVTMRPQDHKALKDSGADPVLVAEAYGALFRGEWGDDFMRRSLSVQFVIGRLAAYQSWKRNPRPATPQRNGHDRIPPGGVAKQRSSWTDSRFRVKTLGGDGDGR